MTDRVPLQLVGIRIELPTNTPILLLREQGGDPRTFYGKLYGQEKP